MPRLRELTAGGEIADLSPSFPCVTCCVQANMTTGCLPREHGVVANGFYWRERRQVEMWTSPSDCIERPQNSGDLPLEGRDRRPHLPSPGRRRDECVRPSGSPCTARGARPITSARRPRSTIPMARNRSGAIRGRRNSTARCATSLGHFPLKNFWGPLAGVQASRWIADSAAVAAEQWQPDFFYIYLPHLDYAAQRNGPESVEADVAVAELDEVIGQLAGRLRRGLWRRAAVAGGRRIRHHAGEPRGVSQSPAPRGRFAGPRPATRERVPDRRRGLDLEASRAWAMVDHQFSHVFVSGGDPRLAQRVAEVFRGQPGIAEVLLGEDWPATGWTIRGAARWF